MSSKVSISELQTHLRATSAKIRSMGYLFGQLRDPRFSDEDRAIYSAIGKILVDLSTELDEIEKRLVPPAIE